MHADPQVLTGCHAANTHGHGPGADAVAVSPATAANPLTAQHLHALAQARQRGRKIRRAVNIALFDAWTTAVIACGALLFGIFDRTSLMMGIALVVIAGNEFKGASEMRQLNPRAPRRLMLNQIALGLLIIVYSLWSIHRTATAPSPYAATTAELADMLEPIQDLGKLVAYVIYLSLILFSLLIQGGTAWFFATRKRRIYDYVTQTPEWIVNMQRIPD